jgi:hypothetical protein
MKLSKLIWGTFLLLAAAFIIVNQLNSFTNISIWSIIVATLSLTFIIQCIASLKFAPLPIPIAVLYIIFQTPLDLPNIQAKFLILASVLAAIGLAILIPRKHKRNYFKYKHFCKSEDNHQQFYTESSTDDNNPSINVNFGTISRRLHANSLETAQLHCNFGTLEIFFDQVSLSPQGATADINCNFGAIKLYIPKHWHIIDRLNCSLGGVDIGRNCATPAENAPQLTLTGNVSLGSVEVQYV